ncbi:plasmid SOS inhibition protein A [Scandinavium goeteborgense]|uniref:PsiA protein n=1 Tax=Scandinavium goeteborgense TaxID=1851514 RepID=A0A4V3BMP8_SCAGO|nr:plasmid SOS inhibition protein A [Scandinavium goeteborgense]TDN51512.1 PsiA protein [Scandinavium goeteborgense]
MIPSHLSLVPFSPRQRAAMQAVAVVEKRHTTRQHPGEFPYARAFFRALDGSRNITLSSFRIFAPVLSAAEFRGSRGQWLEALDMLIESRGACCCLPLPVNAGAELFPSVAFRAGERHASQYMLRSRQYERIARRESLQGRRRREALRGQAAIELAFQTPESLSAWRVHHEEQGVSESDLEDMLWQWVARMPSLQHLERWQSDGQALWAQIGDIHFAASQCGSVACGPDAWLTPNKLEHFGTNTAEKNYD